MSRIVLETERLALRLLQVEDAKSIVRYADPSRGSQMTCSIPSPCFSLAVEGWILMEQAQYQAKFLHRSFTLAFCKKAEEGSSILGMVRLLRKSESIGLSNYTLEYWVGNPLRNQGYLTEAIRSFLSYISERWKIRTVFAYVFKDNLASAQTLGNIEFDRTGLEVQTYSLEQQKTVTSEQMICNLPYFSQQKCQIQEGRLQACKAS